MKKIGTKSILQKKGREKICAITAYDAIFARLADKAGMDIILVGDSLGNTFMGYDSTVPVTMDDMVHHTAMVARANPSAMIVSDIPFAVAHCKFDRLLDESARLLRAGADAVKIEGGASLAKKIAKLAEAGVPVMGHIGLMPQQILKLGAYKTFGKSESERKSLIADAKKLQDAGVFAIVLEKVDELCAAQITKALGAAATIGIGSGKECDGQILVSADVLGLGEFMPPFAKKYAELGKLAAKAFESYAAEVRTKKFPK